MTDKLLSVRDIAERYQVKAETARRYMRQMVHMEAPLMVTERALKAWEESRTFPPESYYRKGKGN